MASPPYAASPSATSPPNPLPVQLPTKKRSSTFEAGGAPKKRRKPSTALSHASAASHPLRQTSFPPEGEATFALRSPSVDASSVVSESIMSATTAGGTQKKKRGRRAKKSAGQEVGTRTPSLAGGKASTNMSGAGGDRGGGEDEDEEKEDERTEMSLKDVVARTQEQKQEEVRLRAMLVEAFDSEQYSRYELWRAARLSDAVVKRVVNATVSQSVPQMVSTAVKAVTKVFAGELIEAARNVQGEWITAGEKQSDLPTPPTSATEDASLEEPAASKRGPLRPEHLREAWRRYRAGGEGYGVGTQQLWHTQQCDGVERFSTRTGRRIFR